MWYKQAVKSKLHIEFYGVVLYNCKKRKGEFIMWLLLPFFPLFMLEALIVEILSPFTWLFNKITDGMDFNRVLGR